MILTTQLATAEFILLISNVRLNHIIIYVDVILLRVLVLRILLVFHVYEVCLTSFFITKTDCFQLVCRDGSVRILHDNATVEYLESEGNVTITGVVEVCVFGTWASVCDRYHIDPTAADIMCKELGYLGEF